MERAGRGEGGRQGGLFTLSIPFESRSLWQLCASSTNLVRPGYLFFHGRCLLSTWTWPFVPLSGSYGVRVTSSRSEEDLRSGSCAGDWWHDTKATSLERSTPTCKIHGKLAWAWSTV